MAHRHVWLALIAAGMVTGMSTCGFAADMSVKAPVAVVAAQNWTGFYAGANIGGGWGSRSFASTANDAFLAANLLPVSLKTSGVGGGLQLGYNWQFARNWVLGVETDFNWSGIKGSGAGSGNLYGGTIPITMPASEQIDWFGTVRGRLGVLPADNLLAYVTGGFAYGRVKHNGSYVNNSATPIAFNTSVCNANSTCLTGSSSGVATGWTLGGGFEYAPVQQWTVKAEYLYVNLGSKSFTETATSFAVPATAIVAAYSRTSFNVARVGLNHRF